MFKSTYFLLVCVLYGCHAKLIDRKFRYDYKYYPEVHGWMKLHRVPAEWRDARLRCYLEGAVLVSPLNTKILETMKALLLRHEMKDVAIFTGIHATFSKVYYSSIDGTPIYRIPIKWAPGEPNNLNNAENCLTMHGNGTMADVMCEAVYPYLCFMEDVGTSMVLNEECGTIDSEYRLNALTGSCYKFHTRAEAWDRAYMTCAAEGGYLAIINSKEESQFLKKLFAEHPENTLKMHNRVCAHIGFHDWGQHGTWTWWTIHGKSLKETGYEEFSKGQPDNYNNGEFCGSIFRSAELNDAPCDLKLSFICEKDPKSLL